MLSPKPDICLALSKAQRTLWSWRKQRSVVEYSRTCHCLCTPELTGAELTLTEDLTHECEAGLIRHNEVSEGVIGSGGAWKDTFFSAIASGKLPTIL